MTAVGVAVMQRMLAPGFLAEVTAKGSTKSSVRFQSGMQADLRVVPMAQFAFALHHFTGSKEHNVAMRQRALAKGYSLSEWGLSEKTGERSQESENSVHQIKTEKELFAFLGLPEIPPHHINIKMYFIL